MSDEPVMEPSHACEARRRGSQDVVARKTRSHTNHGAVAHEVHGRATEGIILLFIIRATIFGICKHPGRLPFEKAS